MCNSTLAHVYHNRRTRRPVIEPPHEMHVRDARHPPLQHRGSAALERIGAQLELALRVGGLCSVDKAHM